MLFSDIQISIIDLGKLEMSEKLYVLYSDEYFMSYAVEQARSALAVDEVPIGAIVVDSENKIIGYGYNMVEKENSQSRHAEVMAIEQAGKCISNWRLTNCTIYVTVEPCLMCLSLIGISRCKRLVYGASSPLFGCHLDKDMMPELYLKHIAGITSGILEDEAVLLLKGFFKRKREKR